MRHVTIMSSKGQIVIPIEIRRQMKWAAGTQFLVKWSKETRRLMLIPEEKPIAVAALPPAGILRDVYPPSTQYVRDLREDAPRDQWS